MADILQIVFGICPFAVAFGLAGVAAHICEKKDDKQTRKNRRLEHRKQARRDMADLKDAYSSLATKGACV